MKRYQPIEDYAAIGNLRTVALVGLNGSIDWCCVPYLDSPSVFAAILDADRGGRFRISPPAPNRAQQKYIAGTNVLETQFQDNTGALALCDFMPLVGPIIGRDVPEPPPELHRVLHSAVPMKALVEWSPRLDYARGQTALTRDGQVWIAQSGEQRVTLADLEERDAAHVANGSSGPQLLARLQLAPGEPRLLVMRWGASNASADLHRSRELLHETVRAWREWAQQCESEDSSAFAGRWHDQVTRSSLALKLLTLPDTGAIAAAATTSLPEHIGGVRNWDYRFAWIRDAAMTGQALAALGHRAEALDFLYFLERAAQSSFGAGGRLQIMYGLHGETELTERVLAHLEGYCGSRPVRIGNAASEQRQLDVFGELVGAAYEFLRHGGQLPPDLWDFLVLVIDRAAQVWEEPDHGIWEVRGGMRHFVHSKLMTWVALDRGIRIAQLGFLPNHADRWRVARAAIRTAILEQGFNREVGAFVQSFGSTALDAANLLIPIVGFLPFDDPRVQQTIDRTLQHLTRDGLVYRYLNEDHLPGTEGAFALTTCWAVDALSLSGRVDEAAELFERVAGHANHVGLFAEEFDPATGRFLGNFPQAFSHIGFINSALYLARVRGQQPKTPAPMGSRDHRLETGHDPGAAA